ncbi:RNA polymerase subunit sigma-70 [Gordonia araii]|nr:RNA polymerase subunit sigma-70 [Gordonia araii]NNG96643.1 RNA polymerase subunit sigma-70 [Gordonia araii NBRC 100433]
MIDSVQPADDAPIAERLESLRIPLTGYCYRMLGGAGETEDAVQETLLRAFRQFDSYDADRARLTTWIHRIAHNVCVDILRSAQRRASPMDLSVLGEGASANAFDDPVPPGTFVDPMPSARLLTGSDPAARVVAKESIRLAFVAALQTLTPRQRAVLILRDVLAFSALETAQILDVSTASVNSALQRARAELAATSTSSRGLSDEEIASLADRYARAFETHDVDGLIAVLHEDATTSMPPFRWWLRGGVTIATLMGRSEACAHDRLIGIDVNGQPGFGQFRPDDDGVLRPFALIALEFRDGRIGHSTTFFGTEARFAEFGLPDQL